MSDTDTIPASEMMHLRIEQRAYQIWEDEGCPAGCELDHWLRAESEIAAVEAAADLEPADRAVSKKT